MKIGFIGLGRMGFGMVSQLSEKGHSVVAHDVDTEAVKKMMRKKAGGAGSLEGLILRLKRPRVVWLMIPSKFVEGTLEKLIPLLDKRDIVIDGGNSWYKDSIRRYGLLKKKKINFLDVGVSGGVSGARHGACMMIGGDLKIFKKVERLFKDMCVVNGYGYMGKAGAGHFVKMAHNGIEYGMMGAMAEGFLAIEKQIPKFKTDLREVSKVYAHGSIIEGKLMSWLWEAFRKPGYLKQISCAVPRGETEEEMKMLEKMSEMPILQQARLMRVHSRKQKVCGRLVAALRNMFGGHQVIKK